ncbi:hypothetical protein Bca52824_076619 [Brassica carinata]|uniref:Protein kinase domain-containing protein n=1 Tax=Brassica carinata TaxID=52824 RepID=A0A8X7TWI1_BRACI|nr:hypothetical protein Bca52824_076619 [Brassica carinata]
MSRSDMSSRPDLAKFRSLCLVICFLAVVTSARVSPRRNLDSPDLRIATLFAIAEDVGLPHVHAESWVGNDTCQQWYGISCTDGVITAIAFINSNLTGIISPRFAELSSLSEIDLAHNRLTGIIPLELLTKLKKLVILDVSYNDLHGKIPKVRKEVVFAEGNTQIEKDRVISRQSFVWIGIGIGFLLAGVIGVLYYYLVIRKKSSAMETEPETIELQAQPSSVVVAADDNMIPFHILREATSDFSDGNLIGRGGFSLVYKGTLSDGTDIAVKRMGKDDPLIGIDTFNCEVSVLSKIHHRNLVVLLGVSDFGLVRSTAEGKDSFTTEKSAGTIGYLPPEYTMTGRITRKLDVYSFGVVLMELLTGQKPSTKTI